MSKPKLPIFHRLRWLALILFPLIWLIACAPSIEVAKPNLAATPPGLATCTEAPVTALPGAAGTPWNTRDVVSIIGDQRSDALAKDKCAHDWRSFYENEKAEMAK